MIDLMPSSGNSMCWPHEEQVLLDMPVFGLQERTDVLANARLDTDVETRFSGHLENSAREIIRRDILSIQLDGALSIDNFHSFGLPRSEMKLARVNQTERFFRAARHSFFEPGGIGPREEGAAVGIGTFSVEGADEGLR